MSTGINFNSAFHRNCGDVSLRTDCWSTSTCTCSVTAKNNINRIKAGTEMGCTLYIETGKNDPGIVTEMTGISPTRIKRKGYPDIPYTELGTHPVFDEKNVWFYDTFDNRKASKYFDLVYQSNEILDLVESRLESFRKVFRRFKTAD